MTVVRSMTDRAKAYIALHDEWFNLCDDALYYDCAVACARFACRCGLITEEEEKLWIHSFATCPGHGHDSSRVWCAYCGDLTSGAEE